MTQGYMQRGALGYGRDNYERSGKGLYVPSDGLSDTFYAPLNASGVDNLPLALTLNSITVQPTLVLRGGDASGSGWTALIGDDPGFISDGTNPTYNYGSPFVGDNDDSIYWLGGDYFQYASTSFGNVGTDDIVLEYVGTGVAASQKVVCDYGAADVPFIQLTFDASSTLLLQFGNVAVAYATIQTAAFVANTWNHYMFFINRDGSGQAYVNGIASGADVDCTPTQAIALDAVAKLTVGANPAGASKANGFATSWVAMWHSAAWLDTHLQATVAMERFLRLCGVYPTKAAGVETPVFTRATVASSETEAAGVTRIWTVGSGAPRICTETDESSIQDSGYKQERAATNIFVYSEDLTNAAWVSTRSDITANQGVAPDGFTTMDVLTEDGTATTDHFVQQNMAQVSGYGYVVSVFAKAINRDWLMLWCNDPADGAYFDLANGVVGLDVGSPLATRIVDYGNGIYRCSYGFIATGTTTRALYFFAADGNGPTGHTFSGVNLQEAIYLWGAQIESISYGIVASSYIKTVAAAVTRNADSLEWGGGDNLKAASGQATFNMLMHPFTGPSYARANVCTPVSWADGGAAADSVAVGVDADLLLTGATAATAGNAGAVTVAGSVGDHNWHEIKLNHGTNKLKIYRDSTPGTADTSADMPNDIDQLHAQKYDDSGQLNGLINELRIKG